MSRVSDGGAPYHAPLWRCQVPFLDAQMYVGVGIHPCSSVTDAAGAQHPPWRRGQAVFFFKVQMLVGLSIQ